MIPTRQAAQARSSNRALQAASGSSAPDTSNNVEFSGYDRGMENSGGPETAQFAAFLAEISQGALKFRNLDVPPEEDLQPFREVPAGKAPAQPAAV